MQRFHTYKKSTRAINFIPGGQFMAWFSYSYTKQKCFKMVAEIVYLDRILQHFCGDFCKYYPIQHVTTGSTKTSHDSTLIFITNKKHITKHHYQSHPGLSGLLLQDAFPKLSGKPYE